MCPGGGGGVCPARGRARPGEDGRAELRGQGVPGRVSPVAFPPPSPSPERGGAGAAQSALGPPPGAGLKPGPGGCALRGVPDRRPRAGRGAGGRLGRALPPPAPAGPALPGRGLRRRRGWTLPGTLWCGAGTSAGSASELGTRAGGVRGQAHPILLAGPCSPALLSDLFRGPDRCCRDHDQCSVQITALQLNYGIHNYRLRTVSHFDAGGGGTHEVAGGLLTAPDCPAGSGGACRPSATPSPTSAVLPPSTCWRCRALCWRSVRSVFSGTGGEGECPGGPLLRTRGWCIRCCRAGCALPGCPAGCRGAQLGHGRADVRSFMARGVCRCERYGVVLLARMVQQSQYHYSLPVQEQPSCTAPRQGKEIL